MARATAYKEAVTALLQEFQQTHEAQELIDGLRQLEEAAGEGERWLRFFEGDTGATSIGDLEHHLAAPSQPNYRSVLESMDISLEQGGLQVRFS
ncbi:hypothetical protein [Pontibacter mangrovi]|uniref:Uncharacterized protein n=1 Tax=Pontibacter mangrovi TaxID=2589816 RepID=A0A501VYH5_9BACT|nr:hypothetical protein [Pontibacter mangrovi]TPE42459.1 hypothetical protein FJM65_17790 [Pontibacter mangrovi]